MIHIDALDFSGWHFNEVISFFWRSVYLKETLHRLVIANMILQQLLGKLWPANQTHRAKAAKHASVMDIVYLWSYAPPPKSLCKWSHLNDTCPPRIGTIMIAEHLVQGKIGTNQYPVNDCPTWTQPYILKVEHQHATTLHTHWYSWCMSMFDNNSVYSLLSAHSIRFDAHGANYYYPGYAWPSQRRTRQTRTNPTSTHLLHLGRERQLQVDKMPCLR